LLVYVIRIESHVAVTAEIAFQNTDMKTGTYTERLAM